MRDGVVLRQDGFYCREYDRMSERVEAVPFTKGLFFVHAYQPLAIEGVVTLEHLFDAISRLEPTEVETLQQLVDCHFDGWLADLKSLPKDGDVPVVLSAIEVSRSLSIGRPDDESPRAVQLLESIVDVSGLDTWIPQPGQPECPRRDGMREVGLDMIPLRLLRNVPLAVRDVASLHEEQSHGPPKELRRVRMPLTLLEFVREILRELSFDGEPADRDARAEAIVDD